jgi:GNAT superfamily N-acetyltransferase
MSRTLAWCVVWTVKAADVSSPDGALLLREYFTEVVDRYWGRPMPSFEVDQAMQEEPSDGFAAFFVARFDGVAAGCAGLNAAGELTRLYIAPAFRRRGGGRVLLRAVEDAARSLGFRSVRLDTRHDLVEARALYLAAGYREVEAFNSGPYADHWFEKEL